MFTDKRIYTHLLPVLICLGLIFGLSSIPRLTGPDLGIPFADKLFHFVEYCGTGFFMARFLSSFHPTARKTSFFALISIMAIVALSDELYQGLIPGRFTDPADFIADLVGAAVGGSIFLLWNQKRADSQNSAG